MNTARSRSGPTSAGLEYSVLWTLFVLTLRQFLRGKRMIVLGLLSLLPTGLALLIRSNETGSSASEIEGVCLFYLVPQVLLPLTALLYASAMILDEQEEQTLTYLLIRPVPKWALYLTKLLATICMISVLGLVFVIVTELATYLGTSEFASLFPFKLLATIFVVTLTLTTYAAVFGCLSLLTESRSLLTGIIYIVIVEGFLANFDFPLRKLSVMYYFRVLSLQWLDVDSKLSIPWSMSDPPDAVLCVIVMLAGIALTTFLGVCVFMSREFHVKTPEGS